MKEFWTLCILVMTVSDTVIVETIPYSNSHFGTDNLFVRKKRGLTNVDCLF